MRTGRWWFGGEELLQPGSKGCTVPSPFVHLVNPGKSSAKQGHRRTSTKYNGIIE